MKISKQARRDGKALFNTCRVNGVLDENRVRQAVKAVVAEKPRGYVATLSHFQRLVKLDIERRTAKVESAAPLPESRRNPSEDFRTHGVKHFGFEVKNLPAVLAELKAKGVKMAFEMRDNPGTAFAFISDNAGNAIELIEHKTPR